MLEIHTADETIRDFPVVCIRLKDPSEEEINDETEARVRREWTAAYDEHRKFYFLVDLRDVTFLGAFSIVPRVVAILQSLRERAREQVLSTGLILTPLADPLVRAVTSLYQPERPIHCGQSPEEVWVKLTEDELE
jgi:hypothetical protein